MSRDDGASSGEEFAQNYEREHGEPLRRKNLRITKLSNKIDMKANESQSHVKPKIKAEMKVKNDDFPAFVPEEPENEPAIKAVVPKEPIWVKKKKTEEPEVKPVEVKTPKWVEKKPPVPSKAPQKELPKSKPVPLRVLQRERSSSRASKESQRERSKSRTTPAKVSEKERPKSKPVPLRVLQNKKPTQMRNPPPVEAFQLDYSRSQPVKYEPITYSEIVCKSGPNLRPLKTMTDLDPNDFLEEPQPSEYGVPVKQMTTAWTPKISGPEHKMKSWDLNYTYVCATVGNFENPKCEWCFANAPMQCIIDVIKRNGDYWHALEVNITLKDSEILRQIKHLCFRSKRGDNLSIGGLLKAIDEVEKNRFKKESTFGATDKATNYHDTQEFLEILYDHAPEFMTGMFGLIMIVAKAEYGVFDLGEMMHYAQIFDIRGHTENSNSKYCIIRFMEFEKNHGKSEALITVKGNEFFIPEKKGIFKIHSLILFNLKKEHYISLVNTEHGWVLFDDLEPYAYLVKPDLSILGKFVHYAIVERVEKKGLGKVGAVVTKIC